MEQMSIFDWLPTLSPEPQAGDLVEDHGAEIPPEQIESFVGKKIVMDRSTESHEWFRVGVLEKILPGIYYHNGVETDTIRLIIYDGGKQRNYMTYIPGYRWVYELTEIRWNR